MRHLIAILLLAVAAVLPAAERAEGSYLRDLTMAYETAHLDWAKSPAGGPIRALVLTPRNIAAREVVELAQRCGLDLTAVTTKHSGALAIDNVYEAQIEGNTPTEKTAEVIAKLQGDYDVIVLANVGLSALPPEPRFLLLDKVRNGTGLLVTYRGRMMYPELTRQPMPEVGEDLMRGIDVAGLAPAVQDRDPAKFLAGYQAGQGRLLTLDYGIAQSAYWGGLSLTPPDPWSLDWAAEYENGMALVIRSLLWSANRDPELRLVGHNLADGGGRSPQEPLTVRVAGARAGRLLLRVRDAWNTVVHTAEVPVKPGDTANIRLPELAGGRHFVDFRLATDRGIEDVAFGILDVPQPTGAVTLKTSKESYERGEAVSGMLTLATPLAEDGRVRLDLQDSPYGRVWTRKWLALPAGATELPVTLVTPPPPTIAGYLVARVVLHDDRIAARVAVPLFFPKREMPLFPTIAWGSVPEGFLTRWVAEQTVEKTRWVAGLTGPSKGGTNARVAALMDQMFVPYITRVGFAANEDKDKKGWTQVNGGADFKKLFPDESSIYDPAVQDWWRDRMQSTTRDLGLVGPLVYNLGDENYYTYDAGYGPVDQQQFHTFLAQRYGTIAKLNQEYGSNYADFAAVPQLTEAEARDTGNLPAWYDHRLFVEQMYADFHHELAAWIREADPYARVGAEGSMPGNLEESMRTLEFWGPYSSPVLDEVLRSLAGDKLRTLWWGGYVSSHGGRGGYPWPLWRPLLQGAVNGNAWFAASIGSEGMLGADLTYAEYFKQLTPHLDQLESGVGALLATTPLEPNGIAIRWDHASNTAALMGDRYFDPRSSMSTFQELCYRHGLNFDYVPSGRIATGGLAGYRILFLFGASSVGQAEATAIEAFVRAGGIVVADLNPGLLNEYLARLPESRLAGLFGVQGLAGGKPFELRQVTFGDLKAKALTNPEIPVGNEQTVGKGQALLLNASLSALRETAADPAAFEAYVLGLLARAGVAPEFTVRGVQGEHYILRVRRGDGCRIVGFLADTHDVGGAVRIDLPAPAQVHEIGASGVRAVPRLDAKLDPPFRVWCLFPEPPARPTFELTRRWGAPGEEIAITSRYPAGAIMRLQVKGPDAQWLPRRQQVFAVPADGALPPLRWAYTDPAGNYGLALTDVRTGYTATTGFQLKY